MSLSSLGYIATKSSQLKDAIEIAEPSRNIDDYIKVAATSSELISGAAIARDNTNSSLVIGNDKFKREIKELTGRLEEA